MDNDAIISRYRDRFAWRHASRGDLAASPDPAAHVAPLSPLSDLGVAHHITNAHKALWPRARPCAYRALASRNPQMHVPSAAIDLCASCRAAVPAHPGAWRGRCVIRSA